MININFSLIIPPFFMPTLLGKNKTEELNLFVKLKLIKRQFAAKINPAYN